MYLIAYLAVNKSIVEYNRMSRAKGTPKTGGRKRGTPNKTTSDLKEWITRLINDNVEQVTKDFKTLSPRDRILVLERLLPYVLPKQQAIAGIIQSDVNVKKEETKPEIDFSTISDDDLGVIIEILSKAENR